MSKSFHSAVLVAVMPMFLFGYSIGVLNAPESVMFPSHTMSQWSTAVSSFCIGGIVGANVSGNLADKYGRRRCLLWFAGYLNILAGLLHVLTPNMIGLILARVMVGFASGASTVITPMYLGEIAPSHIKGSIGTMTQLSVVLGIMASILVALPFCTETKWRFIFVPLPVLSLIFVVVVPFLLPESPTWLMLNHYETRFSPSDTDEDNESGTSDEEVELSMNTPLDEIYDKDITAHTMETTTSSASSTSRKSSQTSFRSFLSQRSNRIALTSSILFPVAQQLSGINAVFYYSTTFFEGVIDNPQNGTILAFFVNVLAAILALMLMDRCGRKTLLSWSAGGMLGCCILLTWVMVTTANVNNDEVLKEETGTLSSKYMVLLAVMLYITFFEIGLGSIPFFLASELIPSQFLGRVQSISMSANWTCNFLVGMLFPYMDKYLGAYSFVPFGIMLFGTVLYATCILPETRGKSLEEVMRELRGHSHERDGSNVNSMNNKLNNNNNNNNSNDNVGLLA